MQSSHTPTLRAVLFDLDDTLFDHAGSARHALSVVHAAQPPFARWPFAEFERAHAQYLEELHTQVLAGVMGIDDARLERFRRLFAASGVEAEARELHSTAMAYRGAYIESRCAVEGAVDLLSALAPRVRIGIVSNNILEEQRAKVAFCGLAPYVDALVVSEEVGVAKPDPTIFRVALDRLGCAAEEAVMVGDSWPADIEGARAAGIRPIWFNPLGRPVPDPAPPVAVLRALTPLASALAVIDQRWLAPSPERCQPPLAEPHPAGSPCE